MNVTKQYNSERLMHGAARAGRVREGHVHRRQARAGDLPRRQDATKPEIKAAVELLFKVQVESVQVVNVGGKEKRFGRFTGRRRNWKKAYVCLKPGQEINFAAES